MEFKFPKEERNVAVFTSVQVIKESYPILFVHHDSEDGAWQFHSGKNISTCDAMIVSLEEIVLYDNSLNELAELPTGYCAKRMSVNDKWEIYKKEI